MLHFSLKRWLIILVPCILLIGATIPLAASAASSTHQASSAQTTTVAVTNRCIVEGPQVVVTLNKGQEIEGTAVMTGNDGNHEEEALALYEMNESSARLIKANFGAKQFEFTANHNNDQIVVCYVQIGGDDDADFNVSQSAFAAEHTASVKYHIEQAGSNESETSNDI